MLRKSIVTLFGRLYALPRVKMVLTSTLLGLLMQLIYEISLAYDRTQR